MAGKLPAAFDYSGEIAVQTGSVGPDDVQAWAGHGVVGKTFSDAPATRDRSANTTTHPATRIGTDGTRGTFDQLYPTGHDKLGLSDQVGWRNIHHARAGVEIKPSREVARRRQLSLVVAGQRDRRALQRRRRARRALGRRHRRPLRRPGDRRPGRRTPIRRSCRSAAATPICFPASSSRTRHRATPTASVRDGHLRVPRRKAGHRREQAPMSVITTQVSAGTPAVRSPPA